LQQLGTPNQSEQSVLSVVEISLHRARFERAMLQMVAELAESVGSLASRVLHRVAHYRAIDSGRCEGCHLPIYHEPESGGRQIDRNRALRKLVRPQPFLESLLRGYAGAAESRPAVERALAKHFEQARRVEHLRAHPALLFQEVLIDQRNPLRGKVHRYDLAFLQEGVELRTRHLEPGRDRMSVQFVPWYVGRRDPSPRLVF